MFSAAAIKPIGMGSMTTSLVVSVVILLDCMYLEMCYNNNTVEPPKKDTFGTTLCPLYGGCPYLGGSQAMYCFFLTLKHIILLIASVR